MTGRPPVNMTRFSEHVIGRMKIGWRNMREERWGIAATLLMLVAAGGVWQVIVGLVAILLADHAGVLDERRRWAEVRVESDEKEARTIHEATMATLDGVSAALRDRADEYELLEDEDGEPSAIAESARIALREQAIRFEEMANEMRLEKDDSQEHAA